MPFAQHTLDQHIVTSGIAGFVQCNECGHSRFGKLEFTATAIRSAEYAAVGSEDDVQLALDALDAAVAEAQEQHSVLATLHRSRISCHGLDRGFHERLGQLTSLHSSDSPELPHCFAGFPSRKHVMRRVGCANEIDNP